MTYDKINKNIVFKLINKDRNADLLQQVPYREYLDLAIVFYIVLSKDGEALNCSPVTNELCKEWGVDVDVLMEAALENTPAILGLKIRGILNTILSYIGDEEIQSSVDEPELDLPLYVVTNNYATYGASAFLYRDLLKAFAARKKSDVYVIPCSIHELIFIPLAECPEIKPSEISNLIFDVNRNELEEGDFLSDNLYFYNCREDSVSIL